MESVLMRSPQVPIAGEWAECLLPRGAVPGALYRELKRISGTPPITAPWTAAAPWVARASTLAMSAPVETLAPEIVGFGVLIVSQDNSCRFCYTAQRTGLKAFGMSDSQIEVLERDFYRAGLSPQMTAGLEFMRKVSRSNPRPDAGDIAAMRRAGFEPRAIAELCFVAACITFCNRLYTLLALPPQVAADAIPWFLRMFPKLLVWMMNASKKPLVFPAAPGKAADGVGGPVLAALAGMPAAGVVRAIIDSAVGSDLIPRRTKLLVMAVVAKALGCEAGGADARRFLQTEGVASATVDEVLTHLRSPHLTELESRLIPFARETVRPQALPLQIRMREVCAGLSAAQTCEVAGILALANALCRLSVVTHCAAA
jgi:alkylhydroperoxidase family enzyme